MRCVEISAHRSTSNRCPIWPLDRLKGSGHVNLYTEVSLQIIDSGQLEPVFPIAGLRIALIKNAPRIASEDLAFVVIPRALSGNGDREEKKSDAGQCEKLWHLQYLRAKFIQGYSLSYSKASTTLPKLSLEAR